MRLGRVVFAIRRSLRAAVVCQKSAITIFLKKESKTGSAAHPAAVTHGYTRELVRAGG